MFKDESEPDHELNSIERSPDVIINKEKLGFDSLVNFKGRKRNKSTLKLCQRIPHFRIRIRIIYW